MLRLIRTLLICACGVIALFIGSKLLDKIGSIGDGVENSIKKLTADSVEISINPIIKDIKDIKKLYLLKVCTGFFQELRYPHNPIDYRITRIRGDALFAVDLKDMKIISENKEEQIIKISLPEPRLEMPAVRPEHSKIYSESVDVAEDSARKYFNSVSMKNAQEELIAKLSDPKYTEFAKQRAEKFFEAIFEPFRWTVYVEWQE